jgi:hypothetical protein
MDNTTFRILDVLSKDLDSPISINRLTKKIKETHGTAFYKNIYDKIQDLKKQNILNITEIGKASAITLNFNDYKLTDILEEVEKKKKQEFLEKNIEMQTIFLEIDKEFRGIPSIKSISIIDAEKNLKLNRIELLFLLVTFEEETIRSIHSIMERPQSKHNIKVDFLILTEEESLGLLSSEEANPLKEMLSDKIAFFSPENFWIWIKTALNKGMRIKTGEKINPAKITEKDLIYNLSRLGYKEFGLKIEQGEKICIEYTITSVLLQDDARRLRSIPILLMKNEINYNLLIFLCKKYKKMGELFGILKTLNKIKENNEIKNAIMILETIKTKEVKMDEKSILEKMRLYDAV